jgi:hypothetical protein
MSSPEDDASPQRLDLSKPAQEPASPHIPPAAVPTYVPYGPRAGQISPSLGIGRIIALVFAALLALVSLGIISGGAVLAWVHESRGADGFLSTSTERLSTSTAALSSAKVDINVGGLGWFADHLGTIRITATSTNEKPIFIGIAPKTEVDAWLGSTGTDQISELQFEPFSTTIKRRPGSVSSLRPPGTQTFWTVRSSGTTTQTLTWEATSGDWTVVVANADGSPGVAIAARFGAKFSWLGPLSLGTIITGVVLFLVAIIITLLLLRGRGRRQWMQVKTRPPDPQAP